MPIPGIKLADFGLATRLQAPDFRVHTVCGTPNYLAPEVVAQSQEGFSFASDIWALGVVTYFLVFGRPPFQAKTISLTYQKILENKIQFPPSWPASDLCKQFISEILQSDPAARPSLSSLLQHPFLTEGPLPEVLPTEFCKSAPSQAYLSNFQLKLSVSRSAQSLLPS